MHYDEEENIVSSKFIQLGLQKQLYLKYGRVLENGRNIQNQL